MTREEWKKVLPIAQAYAEGKTVQVRLNDDFWTDCNKLDFDSNLDDYRIKPESETRSFKNIDELTRTWKEIYPSQLCIKPFIWIQNRFTEEVELIVTYDYANSFHDDDRVETSTRVLTMDDLYQEYRFPNGDICGVKNE